MVTRRTRLVAAFLFAIALLSALFAGSALAGRLRSSGTAKTTAIHFHAQIVLSKVSSTPAGATSGVYTLRGSVANAHARPLRRSITVRLMSRTHGRQVIGHTTVAVHSRSSKAYTVSVKLPKGLAKGAYNVVACLKRDAHSGALSCAAAERAVQVGPAFVPRPPAAATTRAQKDTCSSGAHTLATPGLHAYPDLGNGGYISQHSDVTLVYDAPTNLFLPGTNVALTDMATQCLTDFSVDFERTNSLTPNTGTGGTTPGIGPNLSVASVTVNGQPATVAFVLPTYAGDPNGQNDPDPLAHQASQNNPVSATNPNPPACSTSGKSATLNGTTCLANKMVITPNTPLPSGQPFTVVINYTGRPGVHADGDSTTEGWFRNNSPTGDGAFVTTEPAGTEDWMPLNDHPSAKPTYDFYTTTNAGRTNIANGLLIGQTTNAVDANFPSGGSTTWHWHSPEGIASYLVEDSIGAFDLTSRISGTSGIVYYEAQGSSISSSQKASNKALMDQQEDIVNFQSQFNGNFPFTTDGVVVGVPSASFEEEMQTKITFNGGSVGSTAQTLSHENMHQWWGDNVSEGQINLTYLKEGYAQLGEYLFTARNAANTAGPVGSTAYNNAFEASLVSRFNGTGNYGSTGSLWTSAPSNPSASSLFSTAITYTRPGTAYIALRAILTPANFILANKQIQSDYAQSSITEAQAIAEFHKFLPNESPACNTKLDTFFTQWWDTAYANGGGANKPQITGPGLAGPGFYDASGPCSSATVPTTTTSLPSGTVNGYYTSSTISLGTGGTSFRAALPAAGGTTMYSLDGSAFALYTGPITVSNGPHTLQYYSTDASGNQEPTKTVTFTVDASAPVTTANVSPPLVGGAISTGPANVTLLAVDSGPSGVASTKYSVDGGPVLTYTVPFSVSGGGQHSVQYFSTDGAGNVEATKTLLIQINPTATSTVTGTVNSQLALSLGSPTPTSSLGTFIPGTAATYSGTLAATVITSAANTMLTVQDPSPVSTGHLVNGTFALPQALQAAATNALNPTAVYAPVPGSASPLTLLTDVLPVSNDPVTLLFQQTIGATDALRTGTYSKALLFTLSTTSP